MRKEFGCGMFEGGGRREQAQGREGVLVEGQPQ